MRREGFNPYFEGDDWWYGYSGNENGSPYSGGVRLQSMKLIRIGPYRKMIFKVMETGHREEIRYDTLAEDGSLNDSAGILTREIFRRWGVPIAPARRFAYGGADFNVEFYSSRASIQSTVLSESYYVDSRRGMILRFTEHGSGKPPASSGGLEIRLEAFNGNRLDTDSILAAFKSVP
jgi:hypothetical protein